MFAYLYRTFYVFICLLCAALTNVYYLRMSLARARVNNASLSRTLNTHAAIHVGDTRTLKAHARNCRSLNIRAWNTHALNTHAWETREIKTCVPNVWYAQTSSRNLVETGFDSWLTYLELFVDQNLKWWLLYFCWSRKFPAVFGWPTFRKDVTSFLVYLSWQKIIIKSQAGYFFNK